MLLTTSESSKDNIAGSVVIIVCLIGGVIYAFGYLRAQMHRANNDYKNTKAAVPTLRKAFWGFWWRAAKTSVLLILAVVVLFVWMVHKDKPTDVSNPKPSPTVGDRWITKTPPVTHR